MLKKYKIAYLIVILLSIFIRLWQLGYIPGDGALNQDEAYAGYEAYSLLNYGYDSDGYHNPVYLVAWGSGMNAMETYCMIPFIKIFGLTAFSIRLPMAIINIIAVLIFGLIIRESFGDKYGIIGMGLLCVMPWHIMLSRWGLESNLFPAFSLVALYFLLKAKKDSKYIVLCFIFWGLSLYTYASPWIVMPILIGLSLGYVLCTRYIKVDRYFALGLLILLLLSIPLLLFVLVNVGTISPIITRYISIPRLTVFRSSDVSLSIDSVLANIKNFISIIINQDDGLIWNSIPKFGIFYKFSTLFILIGFVVCIYNCLTKRNTHVVDILINIQFLCSLILGAVSSVNVNRINIVMIPLIYYCFYGVATILGITEKNIHRITFSAVVCAYSISFIFFYSYYLTDYNEIMSEQWGTGANEAIEYAVSLKASEIHVNDVEYPIVLFSAKYPTDKFIQTVEWYDDAASFRPIKSIDGYVFGDFTEENCDVTDVYICRSNNIGCIDYMKNNKMQVKSFGYYSVGYY